MIGMMETSQPPASQPPAPQPGSGSMPSVSVFGDLNTTQMVADNIVTAIGKAAEATPRAGSVTQSSNVDSSGVTTDQVEVTAEYGASQPRFSVRNGTEWSIGMGEGNPSPISDTTPPWKGAELSKRVNGGTVYVEAYTDIEAPTSGASQPRNSYAGGQRRIYWVQFCTWPRPEHPRRTKWPTGHIYVRSNRLWCAFYGRLAKPG